MSVIKGIGSCGWFAGLLILVKLACSYSVATSREVVAKEVYDLVQRMHKNPSTFKNFKRATQVAFSAAASDEVALQVNGLWLLNRIIEENAQFEQCAQAASVALKGTQSTELDNRINGILLLHKLVKKDFCFATDKLEELLGVVEKATKSVNADEQGCGVQLCYLVVKGNKKNSKFDVAIRVADAAMESKNKDVQADGILLWEKLIKRDSLLSTHVNVMHAADIVLQSSHYGTLVSGLMLLGRVVKNNPHFNKIDQTIEAACTAVQKDDLPLFNNGLVLLKQLVECQHFRDFSLITRVVIKGIEVEHQAAKDNEKKLAGQKILTNTVALLCVLIEKDERFDQFPLAIHAAIQATHSTHSKTLFNGLSLMAWLVEKNKLLNTADAEAVELAALRLAGYDDVRVRINALMLLRKLVDKQRKINNLPSFEEAAETAIRSENCDDEQYNGRALRQALEQQSWKWVIHLIWLLTGVFTLWGAFSCIGNLRRR